MWCERIKWTKYNTCQSNFDLGLPSISDLSSLQSTPDSAEKTGSKSPKEGPDDWKQMMLTAVNLKEKSEQEKQVWNFVFLLSRTIGGLILPVAFMWKILALLDEMSPAE